MAGEPDGTLVDWSDIATAHKWDTLLLGNGMSINIWEPFGYRKLYDRARSGDLSTQDLRLFSSTPNFERVLADLLTAIRVNGAVGLDTKPLLERYRNIQLALVHAVRKVHLKRNRVPLITRKIISDTMAVRVGLHDELRPARLLGNGYGRVQAVHGPLSASQSL